ncbi:hypothetical protein E2562_037274 [Oryza meyeriana var. granulata]|uniref:Uncharacterized protein n=1 Tax=Oryza meyeriana var. granulata TaxID=110450 RepID=A0A6G1C2Z7_9ORYZ|nr:hypothetical protein E2562_037274 [Oryza meyeriana var. granulata]
MAPCHPSPPHRGYKTQCHCLFFPAAIAPPISPATESSSTEAHHKFRVPIVKPANSPHWPSFSLHPSNCCPSLAAIELRSSDRPAPSTVAAAWQLRQRVRPRLCHGARQSVALWD